MAISAKWIWSKQENYNAYNQTVIARKRFDVGDVASARMAITADSYYRLAINGEWVNDGPCRSWPEHYQYDEIDVTSYLRKGTNDIQVIARYFGTGTFHQVPKQAGLLVQLDVTLRDGTASSIVSDETWEVAPAKAWASNTPKVSIQMEPAELYDARMEQDLVFAPAAVLFGATEGPWKDLNPRDCALLTREPVHPRRFREANIVMKDWRFYLFPVAQLAHPGMIEANFHVSTASMVATTIIADKDCRIRIEPFGYRVAINGKGETEGAYELSKGPNLLVGVIREFFTHQYKDAGMRFVDTDGYSLRNPVDPNHENPWCFAVVENADWIGDDVEFMPHKIKEREEAKARISAALDKVLTEVVDEQTLKSALGERVQCLPSAKMLLEDPHARFAARKVLADATALVRNPAGLMYDNCEMTVVSPDPRGDIELVYDLGEQNCGYWELDMVAHAGVQVDVFAIEYIAKTGNLQHSHGNRNGFRYVCKDGANRFTSLKRRSGRYLYITLREMKEPVAIRKVQVVESTYPVNHIGSFSCSDPRLDKIWEISERTLKLCMEDTFTDCPLYEQTLWVGDARNESVFAFTAFGAYDLARRCITLTGQSLERFPITGCQVPSAWECILPAWSFLWGISVWDYFFATGDKAFLERAWDWVKHNLHGAESLTGQDGLFSGPFWNMFDWTGIDDNHRTVLHNSMFVVGAIDAALKCAEALGDTAARDWLREYRQRLVAGVNALWDDARTAYPDSVHEDGKISDRSSQHTSFLSILYDIVEEKNRAAAIANVLSPGEKTVRVGSPFAMMYLYEALEKAGHQEEIIRSVYDCYLPMLEDNATTVWESFPSGTTGRDEFPTRSHCHAWSSAPIHFLNRIVLGIIPTEVGGAAFEISPRLNGLTWAKGATAGVKGAVKADWRVEDGKLVINATAPEGVALRFVPNATHEGLAVVFNGEPVK